MQETALSRQYLHKDSIDDPLLSIPGLPKRQAAFTKFSRLAYILLFQRIKEIVKKCSYDFTAGPLDLAPQMSACLNQLPNKVLSCGRSRAPQENA